MAKSFLTQELKRYLNRLRLSTQKLQSFDGKNAEVSVDISIESKDIDDIIRFADKFPDLARIAYKQALMIVANDLAAALDEAMEAPVWQWSDGGTRDIIDTGSLRDSGTVLVDGDTIIISYSEEYAAIVYFGGYVKSGFNPEIQIYYPGRPWVEAVLLGGMGVSKFDFGKELSQVFNQRLGDLVLDAL